MAQNIFNLYSAVAFADHPLACWPLDDDFSFVSLVSASPTWSVTNGSSGSVASPPKEKPQETVGIGDAGLVLDSFIGSASTMTIKTQSFSGVNTDSSKPTVCINAFLYTYSASVASLEIGFEYGGNYDKTIYTNLSQNAWTRISHTASVSNNTTIYPYIKINFNDANRTVSLYNFSVGQWSEQTNHVSIGASPTLFTALSSSATYKQAWGSAVSASPSRYKTYEIDSYGFVEDDNGFYLVEDNKMLAFNANLPMVYGSGNITEIKNSNNNMPSMVFPGKGFLHENGKYNSFTAEFWLRINPSRSTDKRIFGPTTSKDGIYVENEFISLKVGPYYKSYYVGKWYRPMLIHFSYSPNSIKLMINGAIVIDEKINIEDITFPNSSSYDSDWLGFYSDSTISKFQIDSFSIYSYIVTQNMAKRKFVYGQGVDTVDDIVKKFSGTSTTVDFSFANYTKNILYPDVLPWVAGFQSNLDPQTNTLSLPQYSTPEIISYGEDLSGFVRNRAVRTWNGIKGYPWSRWLLNTWRTLSLSREMNILYDNNALQQSSTSNYYLKLSPNSSYNDIKTAIVFKDANPLNDTLGSILGLFSINNAELQESVSIFNETEMVIMQFTNNNSGDTFKILISDINTTNRTFKIKYMFNSYQLNSSFETTHTVPTSGELYFIAGVHLNRLNSYASNRIRNFFKNPNILQLSIGGTSDNQFTGRIYKVAFNNQFFTSKDMSSSFNSAGFATNSGTEQVTTSHSIFNYVGNYTLVFKKANDSMIMDIASAGYWQDSIPLYQLGTYITKTNQSEYYDLDMMQFNIDYPVELVNNTDFDTDDDVKCYVTIQRFDDLTTTPYSNYTIIKQLDDSRYVDFDAVTTNIDQTKFRVVDNTIIFPPKNLIDFKDAYITMHIEIKSPGINTNPMQIKNLSMSSLAYDQSMLYALGTQNGNKIYPFTRAAVNYVTKIKNPFAIYKNSTPYLYLTGDSGIQSLPYPPVDDSIDETSARGILIPINPDKKDSYTVHGFHMWMMFNDDYSITSDKLLFSFMYEGTRINFYAEPEYGGKRARIKAYQFKFYSETEDPNIILHSNGIKQDVYIEPLTWTMLTVQFINPITISNVTGSLELYNGALFNNICVYQQSIDNIVDDIFESHLGLSNIVVQDPVEISVDSEAVTMFSDIDITTFSGRPI